MKCTGTVGIAVTALIVLAAVAHADPSITGFAAPASPVTGTLGAIAGIGVPDGATLGLAWRPVHALRLEASFADNYISPGYRGGVTYIPFRSWATPTLGVAYGHFAERDANPVIRQVTGNPTFDSAMLDRFGYDYAAARVGLEFGRKPFTFYLHAGATRITAAVHDIAAASSSSAMQSASNVSITTTDGHVVLWAPTVDLGFVVYLF
jgi:hypothetical protein